MKNKLLIVVNMQSEFITGSEQAQAIVPNVRAKIEEYIRQGDYIIFTSDEHRTVGLNFQSSNNKAQTADIHAHLDENCINCKYINKPNFGWINWETNISNSIVKDIEEIELIGLTTDISVVTNAFILKTSFPEMKITVDASCCAGVSEESHKAALLTMQMCEINIVMA